MIIMNYEKIDSNNFSEYQTIILLLKNTGLIKEKSDEYQSQNKIGGVSLE